MLFNDLLNKNGVCWGGFFNLKICREINKLYFNIIFLYIKR